jgi:hypothetical protein
LVKMKILTLFVLINKEQGDLHGWET